MTAADEMSFGQRLFIFILYTQVVQALMSYDGGATQFCTRALAEDGWTPLWLGFLGAMDKIGQVATAYFWGQILMKHDAKPLLVVGLFWKASCCFIFGKLQEQPVTWVMQLLMLSAKLGMGITEALISVWATVWVQRAAPHDAKARWLGFAGTSAGIGSGLGSGVASLWSPIYAFFLQSALLFGILGALVLTPASSLNFVSAAEGSEAGDEEGSDLGEQPQFGSQLLFQEVGRGMEARGLEEGELIVTLESDTLPGHYLDASDEPESRTTSLRKYKVRFTEADPYDGTWAQFKMVRVPDDDTVWTFESVRLRSHFLDVSDEPVGWRDTSRYKVRLTDPHQEDFASADWARLRLHTEDEAAGLIQLESMRMPGHFLTASGERLARGTFCCMAPLPEDLKARRATLFRIVSVAHGSGDGLAALQREEGTSFSHLLSNHLWLFTAMAISLSNFVTSGVSFLWQNTVENVWDFADGWSFLLFISSTGIGGLVGVIVGPHIFDKRLGGFRFPKGKAKCLGQAQEMMFVAAVCSTIAVVVLVCKSVNLVYSNQQSVVYWELFVLYITIFLLFFFINALTGMLYGINTDSVNNEARPFAAGLTVSFQNVFGFACGPLVSSAVAEFVGDGVEEYWSDWPWEPKALDGAKFAAGMSASLALTWLLFFFTRKAAVTAKLAHVSVGAFRSGRFGSVSEVGTPSTPLLQAQEN